MSIRVMTQVWANSQHKGSALILMLAIADFADDEGYAYPSVATLAVKCRMGERNTRYSLSVLVKSGELVVKRGAGNGGANLYRVMVERNLPLFDSAGANLAPAKIAPATYGIEGVQKHVRGAAIAIAPEPSVPVIKPSSTPGQSKSRKGKTLLPADFGISDAVRAWALEHRHEPYLQAHLEYFTDYARSTGKLYVDWDGAFRNCIRSDWGKVRSDLVRRGVTLPKAEDTTCRDRLGPDMPCGMPGKDRGGRIYRCDHHQMKHEEQRARPMPDAARKMIDGMVKKQRMRTEEA